MPFRRHFLPLAVAVVALTTASLAQSAPGNGRGQGQGNSQPAPPAATYCSVVGSPNGAGMALGDVTFSGNMPSSAADDCYGILSGNDGNTDINDLGLLWGSDWIFLTKDDGSLTGGQFAGVTFSLDAVGLGNQGGTWTLTAGPADKLPVYVDFVAVLKASNEFALWYFDDVRVGGDDGGHWTSVFTNQNDGLQGLSHMSLYVRQGTRPPEIPPPGTVPEPSGLALAALAVVAAGAAGRRRRA